MNIKLVLFYVTLSIVYMRELWEDWLLDKWKNDGGTDFGVVYSFRPYDKWTRNKNKLDNRKKYSTNSNAPKNLAQNLSIGEKGILCTSVKARV